MKKIFFFILMLTIVFSAHLAYASDDSNYQLTWPGILPDNKLYKLKVLRNKLIEKLIINPVDKVTFDLLMADKTIYASSILFDKREISLSNETALKGENYFSLLVQDYNKSLLQGYKIPKDLDEKISRAAKKHHEVLNNLESSSRGNEKRAFQIADKFSLINYQFIEGLRKPKENAE